MPKNNESIGISAEVAIGRTFNVHISPYYEMRSDLDIVNFLLNSGAIPKIFYKENIPLPTKHIAENQNPVDFLLAGGKTLSVKTNKSDIGRAAPQNIGQPTQNTYFDYIQKHNIIRGFNLRDFMYSNKMADTYENRAKIFKMLTINHIGTLINMYWENMFECDYLILFYNLDSFVPPMKNYRVFGKMAGHPRWNNSLFSFTQTVSSWNESNTLKYAGINIGNFQVHKNRDCFKFRFNMKGIGELLDKNLI